jgi:hypothetical protein
MSESPLSLKELQHRFQQILKGEQRTPLPDWICGRDTPPIPFQRRLEIYFEDEETRFEETMAADFSIVAELVGEDLFHELVMDYRARFVIRCDSISEVGKHFAAYLAGDGARKDHPYLAEVARFEWGHVLAYWAGHPPAIDFAALAQAAEQNAESVVLKLHPSATLFESKWPVDKYVKEKHPGSQGVRLVIYRGAEGTCHRRLSLAEWKLLCAIREESPLGALYATMSQADLAPERGMSFIGEMVQSGVIGSFSLQNASAQ